jgi:hypothetical protein
MCISVVLCAGCGDSSYSSRNLTPPSGANNVDFNTFVSAQFATPPSQTAAPVEVENTQFTFPAEGDPGAFDAIVSSAP